jgi:hypothetical protein
MADETDFLIFIVVPRPRNRKVPMNAAKAGKTSKNLPGRRGYGLANLVGAGFPAGIEYAH